MISKYMAAMMAARKGLILQRKALILEVRRIDKLLGRKAGRKAVKAE